MSSGAAQHPVNRFVLHPLTTTIGTSFDTAHSHSDQEQEMSINAWLDGVPNTFVNGEEPLSLPSIDSLSSGERPRSIFNIDGFNELHEDDLTERLFASQQLWHAQQPTEENMRRTFPWETYDTAVNNSSLRNQNSSMSSFRHNHPYSRPSWMHPEVGVQARRIRSVVNSASMPIPIPSVSPVQNSRHDFAVQTSIPSTSTTTSGTSTVVRGVNPSPDRPTVHVQVFNSNGASPSPPSSNRHRTALPLRVLSHSPRFASIQAITSRGLGSGYRCGGLE